jgi:hypothetical protein
LNLTPNRGSASPEGTLKREKVLMPCATNNWVTFHTSIIPPFIKTTQVLLIG